MEISWLGSEAIHFVHDDFDFLSRLVSLFFFFFSLSSLVCFYFLALALYSTVFMRFALKVKPRNMMMFAVHFVNTCAQLVQGYRFIQYNYISQESYEDQNKK